MTHTRDTRYPWKRVAGIAGMGQGWPGVPQGYPCYSLITSPGALTASIVIVCILSLLLPPNPSYEMALNAFNLCPIPVTNSYTNPVSEPGLTLVGLLVDRRT